MGKKKKTWDEKIKLALNELEGKIDDEKHRTKKEYRSKKEWKKAAFRQDIISHAVMSAAFILTTIALIQGIAKVLPDSISVSNTVNGRELPIYCVQTDKPQVALSFDAAWGNEDTAKILEILKKHNVKVTFFMTGGWVETYPDDVKAILADGHDLGNHSENHKNMSQLSDSECEEELMAVHRKVQELTGYEMFLFRPPYGDYDNDVINVAKKCGYYPIQWDVDSLDWKDYGVDSIIKTVTEHKHLGNGSIILCHNGAKFTAEALDTLITTLQKKGYELVPISELIYKDNYHLDHEGRQIGM
ncbi:MAG: polysaccharide deacetylase family protein [Bacillus sp. (in: Bacteria)]|nr:polysaccharide deacetylase family protein [Bacillus sp. (in: firmicutes)]